LFLPHLLFQIVACLRRDPAPCRAVQRRSVTDNQAWNPESNLHTFQF